MDYTKIKELKIESDVGTVNELLKKRMDISVNNIHSKKNRIPTWKNLI